MGKYGNIDGIATLTHDPIAKDNLNKFNVGNRVMCNDDGNCGTVIDTDRSCDASIVDFDDGQESVWIENDQLSKE